MNSSLPGKNLDELIGRLDIGGVPRDVINEIVSRGPEVIWPFFEALRHCRNRAYEENITETLARIGPAAVGLLVEAIERYPEIRASAVFLLGSLGDRNVVDLLVSLLKDKDQFTRWAAAHALGRLGDVRAIPALKARLKDRASLVRSGAESALAELATKSSSSPEGSVGTEGA